MCKCNTNENAICYFQQIVHHVTSHRHPLTTCHKPDPKTVTHRVPRCQLVTHHLHHCMDTWMNGIPVLAGMDSWKDVGYVRTRLKSMDWFKGKFTGKPHISRENRWFPVDFPLNQSIDEDDGNMMEIWWKYMMEKWWKSPKISEYDEYGIIELAIFQVL